jgi:hypothetical protein
VNRIEGKTEEVCKTNGARRSVRAIAARVVLSSVAVCGLMAIASASWGQQAAPQKVVRVRAKLDGFDIAPTSGKAPNQIGGASRDLGVLTLYAPKLGKAYTLTPKFNWSAEDDKTEYTFKLAALSTQQTVLFVKKVMGGKFMYPADAPALKPSETYVWSVQPENDLMGGVASASLLIVGGPNREAVETALANAKVTPGEPSAAAAKIYVDNRLWFDAIAEYSKLIERHPDMPQYVKDRADVYDQLQETRTLADEDAAKLQH